MLNKTKVLDNFISLCGISTQEAQKYDNILVLSIDYVKRNLKPGVDINANQDILNILAAAIANHKYLLVTESMNSNSAIRIGDISISSNSKEAIHMADKLKKEITSLASHLLLSPNFIFRQV